MAHKAALKVAVFTLASAQGSAKVQEMLLSISDIVDRTVDGVDFASVTVRHGSGRLETVAPSSPLMYVADGLQYELNEGPCYDAVTEDLAVYAPDLAHDRRWPQFGPRAVVLGLGSLLAVRLTHPGTNLMALNMYSDRIAAFGDHHEIAEIFLNAQVTAVDSAQPGETLRSELTNRTNVEHATGILMHHHGVGAEEALDLLSELADKRRPGTDT